MLQMRLRDALPATITTPKRRMEDEVQLLNGGFSIALKSHLDVLRYAVLLQHLEMQRPGGSSH